MRRLQLMTQGKGIPDYIVNLDPAVAKIPYSANIDVRDTIDYKMVMKENNLGPNGAILTSLNLFVTKFDEVLTFIHQAVQEKKIKYVFVDTPGQIEVFTWSASGQIITEALANTYPTTVLYIIDTPRSNQPVTFMSNMLYACSILYKTKVPFIAAFNKTDIVSHEFALTWMKDFEAYDEALQDDKTYSGNLAHSMSLVMDEFYENIATAGYSAVTGKGSDSLLKAIDKARQEYLNEYLPELLKRVKHNILQQAQNQQKMMNKLAKDFNKKLVTSDSKKKGFEEIKIESKDVKPNQTSSEPTIEKESSDQMVDES